MKYKICRDCQTEKYPEDLKNGLCIDCIESEQSAQSQ